MDDPANIVRPRCLLCEEVKEVAEYVETEADAAVAARAARIARSTGSMPAAWRGRAAIICHYWAKGVDPNEKF